MSTASQLLTEFFGNNPRIDPGAIGPHETWWVEHQQVLEQAGYMLRPRYRPGWKPSWDGTDKYHGKFEDGQTLIVCDDIIVIDSLRSCRFSIACASMQLGSRMGDL
jgi:hypothetical protein